MPTRHLLTAVLLLPLCDAAVAEDVTPLELARRASLAADEALDGTSIQGTFHVYRDEGDGDETLTRKGRFRLLHEGDRFRLDVKLEKHLVNISSLDTGEESVANSLHDAVVIFDGEQLSRTIEDERIRPDGYRTDILEPKAKSLALVSAGFPHRETLLHGELGIDGYIDNLGADGFDVRKVAGGLYRATYSAKRHPRFEGELDIAPEMGHNVVAHRAYDRDTNRRILSHDLHWVRHGDAWYARRLETRKGGPFRTTRSIVTITSVAPLEAEDEQLLTLESLNNPALDWKPKHEKDPTPTQPSGKPRED